LRVSSRFSRDSLLNPFTGYPASSVKKRTVKPITIFICSSQKSAGIWRDKFVDFLVRLNKNNLSKAEAEETAREQTLLAISSEKKIYESILKR